MGWLADTWLLLLMLFLPTFLSVTLGTYWLKHERFPWENSLIEEKNRKSE
ncbi:hypothetical protein [Thalassobacillus devorans]|nr:hypothetical protein [Thalassobacillus devorans]